VHCFSGVVWSVASTLPTNHYTDGTAIALCRTAHRCPGLISHPEGLASTMASGRPP